jgi:hypothetical protein
MAFSLVLRLRKHSNFIQRLLDQMGFPDFDSVFGRPSNLYSKVIINLVPFASNISPILERGEDIT